MTENWISCPSPKVGDIIRWKEPVWAAPTKKRGKPDQIGEQQLSAQVKTADEFFELLIHSVEIISMDDDQTPPLKIKDGDLVKRKRTSIERGGCERLSKK